MPINVVAGCGLRFDLGLMIKPAAEREETVSRMRDCRRCGLGAMRATSSRYWMECPADGVGEWDEGVGKAR